MENRNFINGNFVKSISGMSLEIINPANQNIVGSINEALDAEIELAVNSAKKAFNKEFFMIWIHN